MTTQIILVICIILLISYLFDITSAKTKIPSVILLLLTGWLLQQVAANFDIQTPDLKELLPIIGTIGLILIVLEGSLDLELNKETLPIIRKSFLMALIPLTIIAFGLATVFYLYGNFSFQQSLINSLPFCIISSAIAIPSVRNWTKFDKSFITYESSLSDIIGVVLFNFVALNTEFGLQTFGYFGLEILIIVVASLLATFVLSLLLSRLNHHIKFGPILILVILMYSITKLYHLPGLIFVMIFGLALRNIDLFSSKKWFNIFKPERIEREIRHFKEIVAEATFLIRSLFFILFGYMIDTADIYNTETMIWSFCIVAGIILVRMLTLSMFNLKLFPLLFIAPRGLITILLFFSIEQAYMIPIVNNSLIIQVIILSVILMMIGVLFYKNPKKNEDD